MTKRFSFNFFISKYFHQRLLSACTPRLIRARPLIHKGEQRYKQYIVGDPRMLTHDVSPSKCPNRRKFSAIFGAGKRGKERSLSDLSLSLSSPMIRIQGLLQLIIVLAVCVSQIRATRTRCQ